MNECIKNASEIASVVPKRYREKVFQKALQVISRHYVPKSDLRILNNPHSKINKNDLIKEK